MATSIRLDPATERRLDDLAARTGRTKAFYLREAISDYLDDLEGGVEARRESGQVREETSPGYTTDEIKQEIWGRALAISDVISLTEFKADASDWVERLQEQGPVVLTQKGRGRAVVQSFVAYRQMQDSLSMVQLTGNGEADIQAGGLTRHDDVFVELRRELRARRKPA